MFSIADTGGPCDELTPRQAYYALKRTFGALVVPASSKGGAIALAVLLSAGGALAALHRGLAR